MRHYLWSILPPVDGMPDKPSSSFHQNQLSSYCQPRWRKRNFVLLSARQLICKKSFFANSLTRKLLDRGQTPAVPPPYLPPLPNYHWIKEGSGHPRPRRLPHPLSPRLCPHPTAPVNAAARTVDGLEVRRLAQPETNGLLGGGGDGKDWTVTEY